MFLVCCLYFCQLISINSAVCLGLIFCLIKQRELVKYEVILCHTLNSIRCMWVGVEGTESPVGMEGWGW